jgi:type IV pilus assembly protein PilB
MGAQILDALVEKGLLKKQQAEKVPLSVAESFGDLQEYLIRRHIVKESDLLSVAGEVLGVPVIDLSTRTIDKGLLNVVPENTVRRYQFVPIEKKDNNVVVGMVDPTNLEARKALKFVALQEGFTANIYLISPRDLERAANQYRSLSKEVGSAIQEFERELEEEQAKRKEVEEEEKEISAEAPITKVVAVIVKHAVDGKSSDIHIEPLEEKTRVRFRLDGLLHSSIFLPKKIHPAVIARIKIMSNLKIDETRVPQDGRFNIKMADRKIDFRVSTLPTSFGEKAVLRILDPTGGVGKFEDLGLLGPNLEIYKEAINVPFGLILITGPTGSGKSTTLYTTLSTVNSEEWNTITLEDPIEYYIEGVNQSQIKPEIGFSFASGLRSILRQDPDIIMVGEIRDKETATLATHAALTGHVVFSTLHTNDALGIIPRLVNMGVEPYLLPPTLVAGVAQRLVRRLCEQCKQESDLTPAQGRIIEESLAGISEETRAKYGVKQPYKLWQAKGCTVCGNTGTKGRLAIYEMFKMTSGLERIILDKISESILREEAKKQGMITLREDGIMKALLGLVSLEEVLQTVEEA